MFGGGKPIYYDHWSFNIFKKKVIFRFFIKITLCVNQMKRITLYMDFIQAQIKFTVYVGFFPLLKHKLVLAVHSAALLRIQYLLDGVTC